jgi:TPR repeat protein
MPYSSHINDFKRYFHKAVKDSAAKNGVKSPSPNSFSQLFAREHGFKTYEAMLAHHDVPVDVSALNAILEALRQDGIELELTAMLLPFPPQMILSTIELSALFNDQLKRVEHFVPHTHYLRSMVPLMHPLGESKWHIAEEMLTGHNVVSTLAYFKSVLGDDHVELVKGGSQYHQSLLEQSQAGNAAAKHALAVRFIQKGLYTEAFELLMDAKARGCIDAYVELARMHLYALGIKKDVQAAKILYEYAAEQGHNIALNELAHMYSPRGEMGTDLELCFELHKRAVEAGNFDSIGNVGSMLNSGMGVHKDTFAALAYFEMGDKVSDGCSRNSYAYHKAMLEHDHASAFAYCEKAAEVRDVEGLRNLGLHYLYGWAVEKDLAKGLELLIEAAHLNDAEAIYRIALCLSDGFGIERNLKESIYLLTDAAELGHGAAMTKLGVCYLDGLGVNINEFKANEYFFGAVEAGDNTSHFNLSQSYRFGRGVEADEKLAFKHMELAAKAGCRDAMEYLSEFYLHGICTQVDYRQSRLWRHKALKAPAYVPYLYVDPLVRPHVPRAYFTEA